jgi:hypothetical protein
VQVLWWLVPPLGATLVAMLWAGWAGRERDEVRRDDSEEALDKMATALARPAPTSKKKLMSAVMEPSHGVAVRGAARRRQSASDGPR